MPASVAQVELAGYPPRLPSSTQRRSALYFLLSAANWLARVTVR
jgi:hypothetical protein